MRNWFYLLLIPTGILFGVTAFAYGFMAFQSVNAVREQATLHATHPLFQWLRVYGNMALLAELALLGVLTLATIALDREPSTSSSQPKAVDNP